MLTTLYLLVLFGRFIMSWIPIAPDSPVAPVKSVLYGLTEPVLAPLRRSIPPLRLGGVAIDLSSWIVIIGLLVLRGVFGCR
ncbi:MAG: YggT family protein [Actinomycetia bacterium]|nr:YggT family protein [Actinomycetes bacterium]MCP4962633.1 YggT family protein [Actinomycetes bacterium]